MIAALGWWRCWTSLTATEVPRFWVLHMSGSWHMMCVCHLVSRRAGLFPLGLVTAVGRCGSPVLGRG